MKNILLVLFAFLLFSCEKVEIEPTITNSNYRYVEITLEHSGIEVPVALNNSIYMLRNPQNVNLKAGDLILVKYNDTACYFVSKDKTF